MTRPAGPRSLKLSPEQRERLAEALRKEGIAAPAAERIPRRGGDGGDAGDLPLSFGQQRLWFLQELDPASAVYNIPAAVRLAGRLDVAALEAAFGEVLRRHEGLRARFAAAASEPRQTVGPWRPVLLPVIDLSGLPAPEREARTRALAAEERRQPFCLTAGPLLRAALLRLGPEEHALVATLHHIAADGGSAGVLLRELAALYPAFAAGLPSPLPELPVQYADFAAWQR
ncbi:MAG: condensation domain-containing protein, partial [Acidobacteriota bacterium]